MLENAQENQKIIKNLLSGKHQNIEITEKDDNT